MPEFRHLLTHWIFSLHFCFDDLCLLLGFKALKITEVSAFSHDITKQLVCLAIPVHSGVCWSISLCQIAAAIRQCIGRRLCMSCVMWCCNDLAGSLWIYLQSCKNIIDLITVTSALQHPFWTPTLSDGGTFLHAQTQCRWEPRSLISCHLSNRTSLIERGQTEGTRSA